jgi:trans-2,3-dihydro-3-hydroxyanthranilate isomerase
MPHLPYQICDVFTDRALAGNALAVFTDAGVLDGDGATMQALAREMNLSETTFVLPATAPGADARIRIFTPAMELPFAGHPTLGTAFVLAASLPGDVVRLETARGVVPVRLSREGARPTFGWMSQPLPRHEPFTREAELLGALGVARAGLPLLLYDIGPRIVYVELDTPGAVASLRPDLGRLAASFGSLVVSAFARVDGARWKCRVFAPGEGIPEDPATGSAAGPMTLHLARHGRIRFGEEIVIDQGTEIARPSRLHARVLGDAERVDAIEVGGSAVVIGGGQLRF